MLSDNNIVQLWRKADADAQDVVNLMHTPVHPDDERDHILKILHKLRTATAAMQEIERRRLGCGGK